EEMLVDLAKVRATPARLAPAVDLLGFLLAQAIARGDRIEEVAALSAASRTLLELPYALPSARAYAEAAVRVAARSGDCDAIAAPRFALANARLRADDVPTDLYEANFDAVNSLADPRVALKGMMNLSYGQRGAGSLAAAVDTADRLAAASRRFGW